MILRKPYAVFIKYFKLLHFVLAIFISLVLYRSSIIYNFFRIYSIDYRAVSNGISGGYFSLTNYFFVFIIIIITIILLVVMIYKDKPKRLYLYTLIVYILVLILFFYSNKSISETSNFVLDIKVSKAFRDISLIVVVMQVVSLIFMIVRATGFDIKQFDFVSDLQQLDIDAEDSEEIEVSLEFDKEDVRRNFRSKIRNIKYVYFEHKFIINVIVLSCLLIVFVFIYFRNASYIKYYNIGDTFDVSGYSLKVQDSYLLDTDLDEKKITDGVIVAVRIQIKGYEKKSIFNGGILTLKIGDLVYGHDYNIAKNISEIGSAYVKQTLSSDFETYIFTFEVSETQVNKKMFLKFNDIYSFTRNEVGNKNVYVRIKPADLREKSDFEYNKKMSETINFNDSFLNSSSLVINNFDINNSFKLNYNYCYNTDKCINSSEFLSASASGNYFKTLMKLSGEVDIDKKINSSSITDMVSFFNSFGTIHYKIDNEWKKVKINTQVIRPKYSITDDVFIEIPYDVSGANEIYFSFDIRGKNYKYTLK